jgi:serine phosphatase RsbU (regulator of sigma subunit)
MGLDYTMDTENFLVKTDDIEAQNAKLKIQLMNNSLIYELTNVLSSCTDEASILKTVLLGIRDILSFDRVIWFTIDKDNFLLRPGTCVGIKEQETRDISIPLGFDGGEITDSIFLNRHIIVDEPDRTGDLFYKTLNSKSYIVIPLISRANRKCWEVKNCDIKTCPANGGYSPFCWSIHGAGLKIETSTEDKRRMSCLQCRCFKVQGVIWMDRAVRKVPVTSDDITTLTTIINQTGIILENFRIFNALEMTNDELKNANDRLKQLNDDLQIAQARIRTDFEHAKTVQQGLLPQNLSGTEGFSAAARYIPADAVGGDYYDIFRISETVYGIVVADVSGHGISSALIMSMVKVLLKTQAFIQSSPQKTLETINQTFLTEIKTDNFVTIFYAIIDTSVHKIWYTSAGHCPVLLLNKKTANCAHIKADGLFLGIFPDMMLKETCYDYKPGMERLILYTDGLTEARNASDDMFDINHLDEAALFSINRNLEDAADFILSTQMAFCGFNQTPEDDITILMIDL